MGRPATKPARLKDGFYIEVKNQGSGGILIRRDTKEQMLLAAEDYSIMRLLLPIMKKKVSYPMRVLLRRRAEFLKGFLNEKLLSSQLLYLAIHFLTMLSSLLCNMQVPQR